MKSFKHWLENNDQPIWTVFAWSRHHPKGSYEGVYATESEAFAAAAQTQREMEYTGIYFKAQKAPEKHREELLKYGVVESNLNKNDNIHFAGFLKDGRIIVYINDKRYVYVTDTIFHDKWQRMYPYAPWKVLNQIKAKASDVS